MEEKIILGSKKEILSKLENMNKIEFKNYFKNNVINGKWGSGKSFFIEKCIEIAEEKDITILYIDVWKYEYINDIEKMIMIEAILKMKDSKKDIVTEETKNIINDNLDKYMEEIHDDDFKFEKILKRSYRLINTSASKKLSKKLDELMYKELKGSFLEKIKVDLIIFDEVDRVLPETAIQILKFIKYVREIEESQTIYTLAINIEQINAMIKHVYGEQFSSSIYLDKIFEKEIIIQNYPYDKALFIYNSYAKNNKYNNREFSEDELLEENFYFENVNNLKDIVCSYYFRRHLTGLYYGFKVFELRDIENFIMNDIEIFDISFNLTEEFMNESNAINKLREFEKKLMIIFYMTYLMKNNKNLLTKVYDELKTNFSNPFFFKNSKIDIPRINADEKELLIKLRSHNENGSVKELIKSELEVL